MDKKKDQKKKKKNTKTKMNQGPSPKLLGTGMANKAATAMQEREAKRRKMLGMD